MPASLQPLRHHIPANTVQSSPIHEYLRFLLYFVKSVYDNIAILVNSWSECQFSEHIIIWYINVSYLRCQQLLISSYCLQAMIDVAANRISIVPYIHPNSSCLPQDTPSAVVTW